MQIPRGAAGRDAFAAVVVLVVSAVGMIKALEFPARAAAWPMWMWGLLAAFSVILLINSFRQAAASARGPAEQAAGSLMSRLWSRQTARILCNVAFVCVFVALVPIFGFFVTGAVYLSTHMYFLGIRPLWKIAAVTFGALAALHLMFERFLGVLVPHGMFF